MLKCIKVRPNSRRLEEATYQAIAMTFYLPFTGL